MDGNGNIYVTGFLNQTANSRTQDIGTIKYNSNGESLWSGGVTRYDGVNSMPRDIAVDAAGNVYIAGLSDSTRTILTTTLMFNFVAIKYSTDGDQIWAAQDTTGESDGAQGIAVDDNGNVYVTGRGGSDYFTVKYDPSGEEKADVTYAGEGALRMRLLISLLTVSMYMSPDAAVGDIRQLNMTRI